MNGVATADLNRMDKQSAVNALVMEISQLKADEKATQEVLDQAADYNLPFAPGDTLMDARYSVFYAIVRVLIDESNPDKSEYLYLKVQHGQAYDWSIANGRTLMKKCGMSYRERAPRRSPGRTAQFDLQEGKGGQMTPNIE